MRQLPRLVQRLLHVASHLVEERPRRSRIGVDQAGCELQVDREGDQVLLRTVVQLALDLAAVGISGQDEPLPGRTQLSDLKAQPVERFLQFLLLPVRRATTSGRRRAEVVRHRTGGVKCPRTPRRRRDEGGVPAPGSPVLQRLRKPHRAGTASDRDAARLASSLRTTNIAVGE